ncbi:Pyridoxal-dependent decarboxylase [Rhodomicrobium vannielii ATCC 17100]|uniref:Pyridoxal-dependent decarboxylase n=1 Tax=Rhodomicrobium vannielii (strain ATCC 17100 / DSM 162 / LMG 4299 / NCIMB 10020 / ATH 3.1.1) TaxID=648757 RepID=E3I3F0_RHOVT|nr:aminotransferase class V-fold PLP-dependent enzyme [Rhodomicrobium vannielii]ADP72598.1 Pyridoxal-dependent decarboxylase [Rhodomicrobium vannielii ATCC 17100]
MASEKLTEISQHPSPSEDAGADVADYLLGSDLSKLRGWVEARSASFLRSADAGERSPIRRVREKFRSCEVPDTAMALDDYLSLLDQDVLPHCSSLASPRYLGHMTSPIPGFLPELGRLVQTLNQNVVKMETSGSLTFVERQVLGMLHKETYGFDTAFYDRRVQDRDSTLGLFASGGTIANLTALRAAKQRASVHAGGGARMAVIGSELMHYSFAKGADLMGLELRRVPVDEQNRMLPAALEREIEACEAEGVTVAALIAIAGTTEFGSVDPLASICRLGQARNIHVHVDAAWGGGFLLSPRNRHILAGIELADTVTIDGHKQLMVPLGCGMLFFRDPEVSKTIMHHAPYAVRPNSEDQGRFTLEGTRPATAIYVHAALHLIGKSVYDALFSASLERTRIMARHIEGMPEFELTSRPDMNILTYRYIPEAMRGTTPGPADNHRISRFNVALQRAQRDKGDSFVSRTFRPVSRHGDEPLALLRAVLLNPRTTEDDILFLLRDQVGIARELENSPAFHE